MPQDTIVQVIWFLFSQKSQEPSYLVYILMPLYRKIKEAISGPSTLKP